MHVEKNNFYLSLCNNHIGDVLKLNHFVVVVVVSIELAKMDTYLVLTMFTNTKKSEYSGVALT